MRVSEIMTTSPACCTPSTTLREAARMMAENDCGCLPVVDNEEDMRLQGVITDRDIACRAVANGMDPNTTDVASCMTTDVETCSPNASVDECEDVMEQFQVRRVPIVNEGGVCVGMVSQADIAIARPYQEVAGMVKEVSKPSAGML
jgi:CBS domain-containing protein